MSSVVEAKAVKESVDSPVGISLKEMGEHFIITGIATDGLFDNDDSPLKVGMAIKSVNGILCDYLKLYQVIMVLKNVEGELTVKAEHVGYYSATVKKTADTKLGIMMIDRDEQFYITAISDEGLFAGSDLKVGMRIVSINKQPCEGLAMQEVVELCKGPEEELTIMAEDPGFISAEVTKESADTKCGISLRNIDGKLIIATINPEGLFASTDLTPGLKVLRINNKEMKDKSVQQALKIIKKAVGPVSILADKAGFYSVTAHKPAPDAKVGIKLKPKGDSVIVSYIGENSLFADTELQEGMRVISINNNSCRGLTAMEAIQYVINAEDEVTIFAEDTAESGSKFHEKAMVEASMIGKSIIG